VAPRFCVPQHHAPEIKEFVQMRKKVGDGHVRG
jgi:hypothetical protein